MQESIVDNNFNIDVELLLNADIKKREVLLAKLNDNDKNLEINSINYNNINFNIISLPKKEKSNYKKHANIEYIGYVKYINSLFEVEQINKNYQTIFDKFEY